MSNGRERVESAAAKKLYPSTLSVQRGHWPLGLALLLAAACRHEAEDGPEDAGPNETHAPVSACADDADCSEGECLCGVCTVACDEDTDCRAGRAAQTCVPADVLQRADSCGATTLPSDLQGVCLSMCGDASNAVCEIDGAEGTCVDGACVREWTTEAAPCEGKTCGDACAECAPDDQNCLEGRPARFCDPMGACRSGDAPDCAAPEPQPFDPCSGLFCGDSCSECPPDDADCAETATLKYCDEQGTCRGGAEPSCGAPEPQPFDPCTDLTCGDPCSECPPDDQDCVETATIMYCDEQRTCRSGPEPSCGAPEPQPFDPCMGLACGDSCSECPPDDQDCVETATLKYCDERGTCHGGAEPTCGAPEPFDPCMGLACGDSCSECPPDDPDCVETATLKYCDELGTCHGGAEPTCGAT